MNKKEFTLGVEEEYQIVDPQTRELSGRAGQILPIARDKLGEESVQPEIYSSQIEIATSVCRTLEEVRAELVRSRRSIIESAAQDGKRIAAAGTHPFSSWQQPITPKQRYQDLEEDFQQILRELVIFGCHVHVGIEEREMAIAIVNRAQNWLYVLLALSANSPFWLGQETGYASYRTEIWSRMPQTGPTLFFKDYKEYRNTIETITTASIINDPTKIYWDVRLSEKFPTVEFRATDVCLTIDEAVMQAGLIRGLVQTCYTEIQEGVAFVPPRHELLQMARWQAARYGLDGNLIDVARSRPVSGPELVNSFLDYVRPALEELGDWETVSSLVQRTLQHGNGARRQEKVYQHAGSHSAVVDYLIEQTAQGIEINQEDQN